MSETTTPTHSPPETATVAASAGTAPLCPICRQPITGVQHGGPIYETIEGCPDGYIGSTLMTRRPASSRRQLYQRLIGSRPNVYFPCECRE